ncbi:hypothetical protein [uncultured Tyzzerella sp.]|uniref:phage tail assembly chaperone n=1 Tax=uncultured Tyzzerella sp. TaxID=2321398 RepID=UPI002942C702|nr:hypothetical protein [uncultured Tyzzerella sp.]
MSSLQEILNLNVVDNITHYVEISNRLKDENGDNLKFKIKPIIFEELNRLKRKATFINKNGQAIIDEGKLNTLCIIEATLEPSFKDIKSMEQLNVSTPEQYLNKVLLAGEIEKLIKEILIISGFMESIDELVVDIKN